MSLDALFDEAMEAAVAGPPLEVDAATSNLAGSSGLEAMYDDAVADMLSMLQIVHISNNIFDNT